MPSVSEEVLELSAQLLLAASGDLSKVLEGTVKTVGAVGSAALVELINYAKKNQMTAKEKKALEKISDAVNKEGEVPRQITVLGYDLDNVEKWLKKQNVLYAALRSEMQTGDDGLKKCMIVYLDKDREAVEIAVALARSEKHYINELPTQAFLLMHDKKNISVVDGLDIYELEAFRDLAKDYGLVYSAMEGEIEETTNRLSYKILVSKNDMEKAAAIMQQVSWVMTSEHQADIKEKVKERYSIKDQIQKLIAKGVDAGNITVQKQTGPVSIENAKYIVNKMATSHYIKITSQGFTVYKPGKNPVSFSKGDENFDKELQLALGELSGAVVFDAEEWELEGLEKSNLRKKQVAKKNSVFPEGYEKKKETEEMQRARKHKPKKEELSETAWLFDRYDPSKQYSEVYESNYNNSSEPPERTVSVHYENASKHAEKYKYIDVSNDEKSIDNIISKAKDRSQHNGTLQKEERELS